MGRPGKVGQLLVLNLSMVSTHPLGTLQWKDLVRSARFQLGTPDAGSNVKPASAAISRLNLTSLKISIKIPSPVNNP